MSAVSLAHSVPDIFDAHVSPGTGGGGINDPNVQQVAILEYGDLWHFYPLLGLNFASSPLVFGETYSGDQAPACQMAPLAAPSENVAGFNQSQLAGNPVVFRPWFELQDPTGTCYPYPTHQNFNGQGQGPYTPTQQ